MSNSVNQAKDGDMDQDGGKRDGDNLSNVDTFWKTELIRFAVRPDAGCETKRRVKNGTKVSGLSHQKNGASIN